MSKRPGRLGAESAHTGGEYADDVRSALGLTDPERTRLDLALLRRDGGTQPREWIDQKIVEDYAEEMAGGAVFPPVDVFFDGEHYWLADGFHRAAAAEVAELPDILAIIHQGTQRDAVLFSAGVNASHGLRRTNTDKRRAVKRLLNDPEWSQWSDREIGRACKVSNNFVSTVRRSLSSDDSDQRTYVNRYGRRARMQIGGIREANIERAAPPPATGYEEGRVDVGEPAWLRGREALVDAPEPDLPVEPRDWRGPLKVEVINFFKLIAANLRRLGYHEQAAEVMTYAEGLAAEWEIHG